MWGENRVPLVKNGGKALPVAVAISKGYEIMFFFAFCEFGVRFLGGE